MSPPETSTQRMARRSWNCCAICTATVRRSAWSRTTSVTPTLRSAPFTSSTAESWKKHRKRASEPEARGLRERNQFYLPTARFFQSYHLNDNLTVFENLEVPLSYKNVPRKERVSLVCDTLDRFNIVGKKDLFPNQLSGGQQQLVGVARAVIMNPKLILADEPTGNLHSAQGDEIMQLFKRLNEAGTTIIQVTHSERNAAYGNRIIQLKDGWVVGESATAGAGASAARPA